MCDLIKYILENEPLECKLEMQNKMFFISFLIVQQKLQVLNVTVALCIQAILGTASYLHRDTPSHLYQ